MSGFFFECWGLNSGPRVCIANTFQIEPSPQSLRAIFKKTKLKMVKTESVGPGEDTERNLCPEVLEVKLDELYTSKVLRYLSAISLLAVKEPKLARKRTISHFKDIALSIC